MGLLSPDRITTMAQARSHRTWVLAVLIGVYIFNFIDRQVLSILQEDIKRDLNLSDFQLGVLTGPAFVLLYTTMGIPAARIADSSSRKGVVAASLAVWSGFTALCGLAGGFWQLALARFGVGLGQAGGSPPAHAILSDLYEKEKRGRALSIYSAGIYAGTLLAYWLGGAFADAFDWRVAFALVGLPGVLFAGIVWTTVREPVRGLSGLAPSVARISFRQSFAKLWRLKAFRYYALAGAAGLVITYGVGNWMPPFLTRSYAEWAWPGLQSALGFCTAGSADCLAMSTTEVGLFYGTIVGLGGAAGTIGGGYLADHLGARDRRWFVWVPMWGKLISGPLFILALLAPTPELSLLAYFPAIGLAAAYLGPTIAITHHLVPASMRAMSSAVLFFILNIIGLGAGPTLVGIVSDWVTASSSSLAETAAWMGSSVEQIQTLSLKWAMIFAVIAMYPLSILWRWGANALPLGDLDENGDAQPDSTT